MIAFDLWGLPTVVPNARRHWAARNRETRQWRVAVACAVGAGGQRPRKARVTLTRCSAKAPDADNLAASFKPVLDGLVSAQVLVDDSPAHIDLACRWESAPRQQGFVRVEVEAP